MTHKKTFISLFIIVFFVSFCSRGFALSISAQNAINNIRERLQNVSINIKEPLKEGAYVPGQQLKLALNRLRGKIYQAPILTPQKSFAPPKEPLLKTTYIPGKQLARRLKKVYKIIGRNLDIKAKQVFPKITDLKKNLRIDAENDKKKIDTYISNSRLTPFANSLKKYHKLPASKSDIKKVVYKKQSIKVKKTIKKVIKQRNDIKGTESNDSNKTSNDMTDEEIKQFNETLSNQEFKMPRNYRIIVR